MINIPRILGLGPKHARRQPAAARPASRQPSPLGSQPLTLVAISSDQIFCSNLGRVAAGDNWQLRLATSVDEALPLLLAQPSRLIVYDSSNDENWRDALGRLSAPGAHPCILLASRVADEYLRQEVIRSHGYDVLPKGARDEELVRSLRFAWHWSKARINKT